MGATHFTGPVYSENGFVGATSNTGVNLTLSGTLTAPSVAATNYKAADGTTSVTIANSTGLVTMTKPVTISNATVKMTALPTADPLVAGQLWNDSGVLTVSAG